MLRIGKVHESSRSWQLPVGRCESAGLRLSWPGLPSLSLSIALSPWPERMSQEPQDSVPCTGLF